jgi:hypothetical protein
VGFRLRNDASGGDILHPRRKRRHARLVHGSRCPPRNLQKQKLPGNAQLRCRGWGSRPACPCSRPAARSYRQKASAILDIGSF